MVDFDLGSGVAAAVGAGQNLQVVGAKGDGIVIGDDAQVLEAKDGVGVERGGPGAIRRGGIGGAVGKPRVVAAQEPDQKGIGALAVADAGETEFGQEAILEGAKEAFDAPLALRGRRWDPPDSEVAEDPPDLGGRRRALQLLLEGQWGAGLAVKDPMAIGVDGEGDAVAVNKRVEKMQIPLGVLMVAEFGGEHRPGGIVHRGQEGKPGAAGLQPGMGAAIEEDEHARLGHALPAAAMPWRPAPSRTAEAGFVQDAMDGGAGQPEAFPLGEELGEVLMIDSGIGPLGQGDHPVTRGLSGPPGRLASLVAVDEGRGATDAVSTPQAPDLSDTPAQKLSGLRHEELAALQGHHYHDALLHFGGQSNRPLRHTAGVRAPGGRTFSLNS